MNGKYMTVLTVCLFILAIVLPDFARSDGGNSDVCEPEIIGQIQQGKSSKEMVV